MDGKYAMDAGIPEQFCQLISGFYALDHLQFEVAARNYQVLMKGSDSLFFQSGGRAWVHGQDFGIIIETIGVS